MRLIEMEHTAKKVIEKRGSPRHSTAVEMVSRPYTSTGTIRQSNGIIRNFSNGGVYIETPHTYKSGTILVIRATMSAPASSACVTGEGLRTICLAEVKWQTDLSDQKLSRYGIGLRYLE